MDNQSQAPPQSTAPEAVPSQQTQNPMSPQPQPSMMQPQPLGGIPPPGGSSNKSLGIKCAYILVGLLGMALTVAALNKASYYESVCTTDGKREVESNPWYAAQGYKCEQFTPLSYDQCTLYKRLATETIQSLRAQGAKIPEKAEFPTCPSKWLVEPQAYILGIIWFASAIILFVTIFLGPKFSKIDGLVLLVSGGITLLCAFLMMIFFIWLVSSDFWCGHEGTGFAVLCNPKFAWGSAIRTRKHPLSCYHFGLSDGEFAGILTGGRPGRGYDEKRNYTGSISDCGDFNKEVYQAYLLLVGTLFAGAAGIIAIVGGIMQMKKGPSQGMGVGAVGQYNNLGLQNKSMGPYQQTSQMGMGSQPQNMQMMGQQQQQYGQPTPSWQAMQAQAAQQYRAGRGGPR